MTRPSGSTPARGVAGHTLLEVAIFLVVLMPLMMALASGVGTFTRSAQEGMSRLEANARNHEVLQRIAAELSQSCSRIDHTVSGAFPRPQPEGNGLSMPNHWYDWTPTAGGPDMDVLFDTMERDGQEHWHPLIEVVPGTGNPGAGIDPIRTYFQRRYYIYATYDVFDTIEYQKVLSPRGDQPHIQGEDVCQPWSGRRKIFLEDGRVILRVDEGDPLLQPSPGPFRDHVLGTDVETLHFHVNAQGHLLVRLTTRTANGRAGGGEPVTTQLVVHPRNQLF